MDYIASAFSLNMAPSHAIIIKEPVKAEDVPYDVVSAVGHASTAAITSTLLGFEVECNRMNLHLDEEDKLYVCQYTGPRLPEGVTVLPPDSKLEFFKITVVPMADDRS